MSHKAIRILLIEDDANRAERIREAFAHDRAEFSVRHVTDLAGAREVLQGEAPDLVLSEQSLPDGRASDLWNDPGDDRRFPMVVLTEVVGRHPAMDDEPDGMTVYPVRDPSALARLPWVAGIALREWSFLLERQRIEQELGFKSELLNQIGDAITATDLQARITYVNAASARDHAACPEDLIGRSVEVFGEDPERGASQREIIEKTQANGEWQGEVVNYCEDGSEIVFHCRTWLMRDEEGGPVGMCGVSADITDRKRMEKALGRRTRQLESITANAPDIIARYDRELRYTFVNERITEASGIPREVFLGKNNTELGLPGNLCGALDSALRRVVETGEPAEVEFSYEGFQGVRYYQARIVPEFTDTGQVESLLSISRDVTEQKLAEEEHRELMAQVQHAQKLESLGVLAGGIAHDFNNLLVGMLGNASLALMDLQPESPVYENLRQIERAAQRAADLTNQMLAYSGKGKFIVQSLDLSRLVEEMAHLLESVISKRVVLQFDFADDVPAIEADATQLRQVAMNLITNASEAIGDRSGTILVRTSVVDADRAYLERTTLDNDLVDGRYVCLEVSDTGCGMDEATQKRIFDPFFTSKFAGRGLGLAAVMGIVRGHGGTINVYSELGKGTTFKILLPSSHLTAEAPRMEPEDATEWQGRGTVLVVDDEPSVLQVARSVLERIGLRVIAVENGRQAIDALREHAEEIVAVVLDMTMPDMNGEEAFRELRRIRPDVKVILSSGYNEQEVTSRFAGKGLAGFIQKPYRPTTLLAAIRRLLEEEHADDRAPGPRPE